MCRGRKIEMILLRFWKKHRNDFLPILLLLGLSFYSWRLLLEWIIQFEGFSYLTPQNFNRYLSDVPGLLSTTQTAGVILGASLSRLVGVNIPLYMWIQLIIMLCIGALFYFVVNVVIKNRFIAFSSALIHTVSYFGNFNTLVVNYSNFLERASANIFFLLLSFMFLHLFLEKTKQKYYIISVVLFFLGILSSRFSIFFTAPYFFYPFFWHILNKKSVMKGFAIGIPYVLISGFFIYLSSIGIEPLLSSNNSFLQFVLQPQKYLEGMLLQLVYWSQYPSIIKALLGNIYPLSVLDPATGATLKPTIVAVYAIAIFAIYKVLADKRALLFTIIFATSSMFLLNIFVGRYDPFYTSGTHRTLYFPTYLLAIFWSFFLWIIVKNKNLGLKAVGIILLGGYYYINTYLIYLDITHFISDVKSQKAIFNHIINTRSKLKPNTLVIGPYPDLAAQYESPFFTDMLGKGEVRYMVDTFNITDWRTVASSSSHVIHLKFDTVCQCVVEEKIK